MSSPNQPARSDQPRSTQHLEELGARHLWMHFSRMGSYAQGEPLPIIDRYAALIDELR